MANLEFNLHYSSLRTNAKHTFVFENVEFDYHLIKEERKTMAATVYPNQSVVVKVPLEAKNARIEEFLKRKCTWVHKQQRYFARFKPPSEKQYVSGETFRYLGRTYKLLVRKAKGDPRVSLQHGTLTVYSAFPQNRLITRKLVEAWYAEKTERVFRERLAVCFGLFDYAELPSLGIRKLKKRWGSYLEKPHRIILNQDLIRASKAQIDYVIVHELCHVRHKQHNQAFRTLLESKLPNWEKLKTELELKLLA
jgi:predicted metal-dependent hydrolase